MSSQDKQKLAELARAYLEANAKHRTRKLIQGKAESGTARERAARSAEASLAKAMKDAGLVYASIDDVLIYRSMDMEIYTTAGIFASLDFVPASEPTP